jgi:NAD/NADP transhydrogenase beta subunit
MLMNRQIGLVVVVAGALLIGLGVLIYSGALRWFGKLPGDIRYQSDHAQFYAPIVSMLIISLVLSLLFYLAILLSQHQTVGFVSLQPQFARGFL